MTTLKEPPQHIIRAAERAAAENPPGRCVKSRRGAVLFDPKFMGEDRAALISWGCNSPPYPFQCAGTERCRRVCGQICEHAEARAIDRALLEAGYAKAFGGVVLWRPGIKVFGDSTEAEMKKLHLVHVKLGPDDRVTAGGPPKCAQCSKRILGVGFVSGVWLYEKTPADRCPHLDLPMESCSFCKGSDCIADRGKCDAIGQCHHDVLERHGSSPLVAARWRFYEAEEFHRLSLANNGIGIEV